MTKLISERKFDQDQVEKLNRSIIELCTRESCNFEKFERAIILFSGHVTQERRDKCKHIKEDELAANAASSTMNALGSLPFFGPIFGTIGGLINAGKTISIGYLREQWGCDGIATDEIKDMVDRNYELIRKSLVAIDKNYQGKFD